jgi:hypothetical protein
MIRATSRVENSIAMISWPSHERVSGTRAKYTAAIKKSIVNTSVYLPALQILRQRWCRFLRSGRQNRASEPDPERGMRIDRVDSRFRRSARSVRSPMAAFSTPALAPNTARATRRGVRVGEKDPDAAKTADQ